jgi:hypothetical protein
MNVSLNKAADADLQDDKSQAFTCACRAVHNVSTDEIFVQNASLKSSVFWVITPTTMWKVTQSFG